MQDLLIQNFSLPVTPRAEKKRTAERKKLKTKKWILKMDDSNSSSISSSLLTTVEKSNFRTFRNCSVKSQFSLPHVTRCISLSLYFFCLSFNSIPTHASLPRPCAFVSTKVSHQNMKQSCRITLFKSYQKL